MTMLWKAGRSFCRFFTTLMFDLKVYGRRNVPRSGGALLISNHESFLDPVVLGVNLPRMISFMARSTLFEKPLFAWLINGLNSFPVRRGESDIGAIKEALRRLEAGDILTIFPEGTRSADGEIGAIQPGIAMIVRRAGVPVIPAVVVGAWDAWPRRARFPRRGHVRVMYGPPLDVGNLKGKQIVELIDRTLRGMQADLRASLPAKTHSAGVALVARRDR